MLDLSIPWWEFVARAAVVYAFLLVLLRLSGKRQVGELAPFDLVLLLILSEVVGSSLTAGDESVIGGLIGAATLVALNFVVSLSTFYSRTLEGLIEGKPEILINHGKISEKVMRRARLTYHELNTALRNAECSSVHDVKLAILENTGAITVVKNGANENPLGVPAEAIER